MKLAIMQPYFFPYLGYFQLLAAVDRFVFLDDVHYTPRTWINRNRLLRQGQAVYCTVPVRGGSQNKRICDVGLAEEGESPRWRRKLLAGLQQDYRAAPQFEPVYALVASVLNAPAAGIAELARHSVQAVVAYLGGTTQVLPSSAIYGNQALSGQARILDICRREGAATYINAPGGRALYQPEAFKQAGVQLCFLQPSLPAYPQFQQAFVAGLSIIDVLMFNPPQVVAAMLGLAQVAPPA